MTTVYIPDKLYNAFRDELAPDLPAWDALTLIHVYYAGRKAAAREQEEQRRRLAGEQ